jgi:hypothetical protein
MSSDERQLTLSINNGTKDQRESMEMSGNVCYVAIRVLHNILLIEYSLIYSLKLHLNIC